MIKKREGKLSFVSEGKEDRGPIEADGGINENFSLLIYLLDSLLCCGERGEDGRKKD